MTFTFVGLPSPCPGAFDCVLSDLKELFVSPPTIIGGFSSVILLLLLWRFTSKKYFRSEAVAQAWAVAAMVIAITLGMLFYSPHIQYQNLKSQYGDLQFREEQVRFQLEQETVNRRTIEGRIREVEEKLKTAQDSLQRLQEKGDEILRNLSKTKGR